MMQPGEVDGVGLPLGPLGNAGPRGLGDDVACRVKVGVVGVKSAEGVGCGKR